MQRTLVITGAAGFIGRYTARLAANLGYCVIGVGHGKWLADEWRPWGLSGWLGDDITIESLRKSFETPHAIIHFAGGSSVPFSIANPLPDFERTVLTTARVLEYVRTHSPGTRIIYCSSASVYGLADVVPIPEETQPKPISPYGVHKHMAEQMIGSYVRQFDLSASIIRLFSVYGCGLRKQLLWDACRKIRNGDTLFMGTGLETRDWLHVEDAASLILAATGSTAPGCSILNGGCGHGVKVSEILTEIASHLSPDAKPRFSGVQRIGDPICLVADIRRALSLGWCPVHNWPEGIAQYAQWWLQEDEITQALLTDRSVVGGSSF